MEAFGAASDLPRFPGYPFYTALIRLLAARARCDHWGLQQLTPDSGELCPPSPHAVTPSTPAPSPTPRFQVQCGVLDALKAALALEDQLVQNPHARIQVRVPDSVGVKRVELVPLRHLEDGLLQLVEKLQTSFAACPLLASGSTRSQ